LTQQQPTVFDLPKVLAVGILSPAAAAITSRFGITGTLLGLVLSSVFVTAGVDLLKVYLARVPGAVTTIPGGLKKKSSLRNFFERIKQPFSKFASLPHPRRRSLIVGSLLAAGLSCLIGLILITVLEVGVGKSLSCWIWDDCSTESSSSSDGTSSAQRTSSSTLPTILGGGQSTTSSTSQQQQVSPSSSPQEQPQPGAPSQGAPGVPSQAPSSSSSSSSEAGSETLKPSPSVQPDQRQAPSGNLEENQPQQQQEVPSKGSAPADQQPSSSDNSEG
jgi:hypothetical protein